MIVVPELPRFQSVTKLNLSYRPLNLTILNSSEERAVDQGLTICPLGKYLYIGLEVCVPHNYCCGTQIDKFGLPPLSFRSSPDRFPRYFALNDAIKRFLGSAGFMSKLEPVDLDRGDGKCPNGITRSSQYRPYNYDKALI